ERPGPAEQSSPDLHDRVYDPGLVRHEGTVSRASSAASSSATAAAGAWRAAGPSEVERWVTVNAARRAASRARKSTRPGTTASANASADTPLGRPRNGTLDAIASAGVRKAPV